MRQQPKKTRVWGELSIEDYLRVIGAPELVDLRKKEQQGEGNGATGRSSSPHSPPKGRQGWRGLGRGLGIAVVLIGTFGAGTVWRWEGRWSRSLTYDQARQVVQDPTYSDNEIRNALRRVREEIEAGLIILAEVAGEDTRSGMHARAHLERSAAQSQELLTEVRDR